MKSRGPRGTPRQEPERTTTKKAPPPPVRTILDELRQWGISKAFVHQFKLLADRIIPKLPETKPRKKREGDGPLWQRRDTSLQKKPNPNPQEPPPPVLIAEQQTADEVTRPAVKHARSMFWPFRFH